MNHWGYIRTKITKAISLPSKRRNLLAEVFLKNLLFTDASQLPKFNAGSRKTCQLQTKSLRGNVFQVFLLNVEAHS